MADCGQEAASSAASSKSMVPVVRFQTASKAAWSAYPSKLSLQTTALSTVCTSLGPLSTPPMTWVAVNPSPAARLSPVKVCRRLASSLKGAGALVSRAPFLYSLTSVASMLMKLTVAEASLSRMGPSTLTGSSRAPLSITIVSMFTNHFLVVSSPAGLRTAMPSSVPRLWSARSTPSPVKGTMDLSTGASPLTLTCTPTCPPPASMNLYSMLVKVPAAEWLIGVPPTGVFRSVPPPLESKPMNSRVPLTPPSSPRGRFLPVSRTISATSSPPLVDSNSSGAPLVP